MFKYINEESMRGKQCIYDIYAWYARFCADHNRGVVHSKKEQLKAVFAYNAVNVLHRIFELRNEDDSDANGLSTAYWGMAPYSMPCVESTPIIAGILMYAKASGHELSISDRHNGHLLSVLKSAVDELGIVHPYICYGDRWSDFEEAILTTSIGFMDYLATPGLSTSMDDVFDGIDLSTIRCTY